MTDEIPELPPKAKQAFDRFSKRANKLSLHPYDWDYLYRFVYVCRATRVNLSEVDMYRLLMTHRFRQAEEIAGIFDHLNNFARMRLR